MTISIDAVVADKVCAWFPKYLTHTKGRWAGQPFLLADWQSEQIIRPLFGTLNRDGTRRFRTALLGTPRKAGKSTLGAGIALRMLFADGEPGSEVYSCAADKEQAAIVFDMAKAMVEANPALSSRAKIYRRSIVVPHTSAVYKVLSADAYTKHGLNPSAVVFDEVHAQAGRELWDVMTTGQGARAQPLTVGITTAGVDKNTICGELYDYGRQLEAGALDDPTFFFRWWGAAVDDDWRDPEVWAKAHPGLGISVSEDFLTAEAHQAANLPARQNTFRRLYLNQWTTQLTRWLDLADWDDSAGMVIEDNLKGRRAFGGLDLASTTDVAALCWTFPNEDGSYEAVWRFWIPADRLPDLDSRTAGNASVWVKDGFLQTTPGNVIDYDSILNQIDRDAINFDVAEVAFDRWGATQIAQSLQDRGLRMIQFGQGFKSMSAPTKDWERLILAGEYRHGGNPVMRWMVDNITIRSDPAGNIKIDKQRSHEKVDGCIAAVMALDAASRHNTTSIYETEGIEVF